MNKLSSILNFIANKIGNVSMGTTATSLTGAIAEVRKKSNDGYAKGTYTGQILYGVYGYMGASGHAHVMVPMVVDRDVTDINITSFVASIRTVDGTYLGGGSSGNVELVTYLYQSSMPSIKKKQGFVYVHLLNSNFGVTANTPLAGQATVTFTLS